MSRKPKEEPVEKAAAPVKKKSKLLVILIIIAAMAASGGGVYFFIQRNTVKSRLEADKHRKAAEEDQGDSADEESSSPAKDSGGGRKDKPADMKAALVLPKDEDVKRVIEVQPFVLNLADKEENHFLRVSVSLGLADEGTEKPDQVFTARVRNAILAVLMTKTSEEILSAEGKAALRKELLQAVRTAASEPRVEAVYITELLVQR